MTLRRAAALLSLVVLGGGCGGGQGAARDDPGEATLWITRDRGAEVIRDVEVPAGQTVLEALRSEVEVKTSQGGRFVQAVDGLSGSLEDGADWFYYVNGLLADRGAADYRLRDGDVVWWDYRDWAADAKEVRAVVGAFPEPFLHGYDGRRRPAAVRYEVPDHEAAARALGLALAAESVARVGTPVPKGANLLLLEGGPERFIAEATAASQPVRFVVAGEWVERLARRPEEARMRFEGLPEDDR